MNVAGRSNAADQCPPPPTARTGRPSASRGGPLVPDGATGALLCTYTTPDAAPSPGPARTSAEPTKLAAYLNGLPHDAQPTDACADMGRPRYAIVLSYPQHAPVTVVVDPNCGTAEQGGAVRSLTSMSRLLAYWA